MSCIINVLYRSRKLCCMEATSTAQALDGFSLETVARELGIHYRTCAFWCSPDGLVSPAGAPKERKQCHKVLLDFEDILELQLISTLRKNQISMAFIRPALATLRKNHPRLLRKIIREQSSKAPRAFFIVISDRQGQTVDVLAVDLAERAVSALRAETRQLVAIDVRKEGRQVYKKFSALMKENGLMLVT